MVVRQLSTKFGITCNSLADYIGNVFYGLPDTAMVLENLPVLTVKQSQKWQIHQ